MNKQTAINKALESIDNDFIKALVEPARIEILKLIILNGPSDVKTLSDKMPQDRSVISRHLVLMEKAGLLNFEKQGRHMIYSVDTSSTLQKSEQLVESIRECLKYGCC